MWKRSKNSIKIISVRKPGLCSVVPLGPWNTICHLLVWCPLHFPQAFMQSTHATGKNSYSQIGSLEWGWDRGSAPDSSVLEPSFNFSFLRFISYTVMKLRCLLFGRKAMTNLDSILKSRDITLLTKVLIVKAMVFPVVMCGCENWTLKKAKCWRIDAFEL